MIHSGSRGLGYQVCDDALDAFRKVPDKYGIVLPDRQLVCAPVESAEGRHYLSTMRAAANFAWANRQLLMWQTRETFADFFGRSWESMQMNLVYDVAHNIAKLERHKVRSMFAEYINVTPIDLRQVQVAKQDLAAYGALLRPEVAA